MYLFSFSASYVCLTLVVDSANFKIQKKCHLQLIMRNISLYWLFGLVDSTVIEMIMILLVWLVHLHVPWHAVWNGYGCDRTHSNTLLVGGCLVGAPSLTVNYT